MLQRSRKRRPVEHVGDAAAHARREVAARRAEHHHLAAGHVLAAVVADALDDRRARRSCARQNRSPARPRKNARPDGGAVEDGVADDHVLLGQKCPPTPVGADAPRRPRRRGPCRRSRSRRPRSSNVTPGASQAPKLWPAEPSKSTSIVPSGRPSAPWRWAISLESMPPTRAVDVADRQLELHPARRCRRRGGRGSLRSRAPSRARRPAPVRRAVHAPARRRAVDAARAR